MHPHPNQDKRGRQISAWPTEELGFYPRSQLNPGLSREAGGVGMAGPPIEAPHTHALDTLRALVVCPSVLSVRMPTYFSCACLYIHDSRHLHSSVFLNTRG